MKTNIQISLVCMALATASITVGQGKPATGLGGYYYELGGSQPYLPITSRNNTNIKLGAGLDWSLGGVCGFDPEASFKHELENARTGLQNLGKQALAGFQNVLIGSALSEIRALNPGLYDTLSRGILDAKENVNVAIKSCEQINSDVLQGKNPVDGWITLSKRTKWAMATAAGENPTEVRTAVLQEGGNDGVSWVGGQRTGGIDQPVIEVVSDTIERGYTQWGGSDNTSVLNASFNGVEDAQEWVTAVVGDNIIRTCVDCEKIQTKIGQGLKLQFARERKLVFEELTELLQLQSASFEPDDLAALAVPGMGLYITEPVILSLRSEDPAERELLANRLSSEIALARTVEKALLARSLLRSGLQEPNIQANQGALRALEDRLEFLGKEIDNVLFEQRVRKEVLTNTAQMILTLANERDTAPVSRNVTPAPRAATIKNGAITTQ